MISTQTLLCFLGASAALTISPGPDNMFVIAQGIARGRRAAILVALGMCGGVSVHTTAAALGISALLYSSATAFALLKYAGAAYLLFLAWKAVKENGPLASGRAIEAERSWALFRRGFLMNVINPKVALFFLAFLPQFVSKTEGAIAGQMLLLGAIFMAQGVVVFSLIGYLSGGIGQALARNPTIARRMGLLTAAVLASLGLRLAFARQ